MTSSSQLGGHLDLPRLLLGPFWELSHLLISAAEAQLESAKNIDTYKAGCIISVSSSLETQNWTPESIWNREDIKKKDKTKKIWIIKFLLGKT